MQAQAAKQPEATIGSRKPPEFIEKEWSHIYKCFTKQKRGGLLTLEWILDWTLKGTLWERESYKMKYYFVTQAMYERPIILKAYSRNDPDEVEKLLSPLRDSDAFCKVATEWSEKCKTRLHAL